MFSREEIDRFLNRTPRAEHRRMRWEFWFRHPELARLEKLCSTLESNGFTGIEIRGILDEEDPERDQYMVCEVIEENDRVSLWKRCQQLESLAEEAGVTFDGYDVSNVDLSPLR